MQLCVCVQGVIYPVSHRSLRIKFWVQRTNCETQSKKCESKKSFAYCEAVQSMHSTRFAAACAVAITSTISCAAGFVVLPRRSPAPVLNSRRVADDTQFPNLSAHSFRDSSTIDREIYLVGLRFHFCIGRLSRNGSKLVDSLEVEEGARCSRRVAPLRRGNGG